MPHLRDAKVVVITARPMMAEEARQYNVARIFLKPVRAVQLVHTLHEILDATA